MACYRLYFMDVRANHVARSLEFVARTDEDALRQAEEYRGHMAMELWCGRAKVKHWPANFAMTD